MAKRNLFHPEISQSETDDLFNGTLIPRKPIPVAVTGNGVLKRGLPLMSADGVTFTAYEPAEEDEPANQIRGILLFDIDTSETEEAANAVMMTSGEFNRNKVEDALGEELDPMAIMDAWGKFIHIEASKTYPAVESFPLG